MIDAPSRLTKEQLKVYQIKPLEILVKILSYIVFIGVFIEY